MMPSGLRFLCLLTLLTFLAPTPWAAPPESATDEIEHLLDHLAAARCSFNRNGRWYAARDAEKHLRRKYDYLLRKDLVSTAESFVALAATSSSVSGRPYLVRCGDEDTVESSTWLLQELQRYRERSYREDHR